MKMTTAQIHDMIAGRMVEALEAGTVPWQKPWTTQAGLSGFPTSLSSREHYRGVNVWTLGLTSLIEGYGSPWWGTYNRIAELSGMEKRNRPSGRGWYWASPDGTPRGVRKGETSTMVVFWKSVIMPDAEFPNDPEKNHVFLTGHTDSVFNACQAAQLPDKYCPGSDDVADIPEIPEPQAVLDAYIARGPSLVHAHQDRAFYRSGPDTITLPLRGQFGSAEEYYTTAFHEAGHSTGHPRRLDRPGIAEFDHFGSAKYGKEELAAEMTAAMLCAATGVEGTFGNSANYVASWIDAIKGDAKMVSGAASQAQAALDMVLGTSAAAGSTDAAMAIAA